MRKLPSGWTHFTIAQIGGLSGGKTPSKANREFWSQGTIPWISPKDMKTFEIASSIDHVSDAAVTQTSMEIYPEDSVLLVTRSGILDHTLPVAIAKRPVTVNQDVKVIRPRPDIDPKFLAYNLLAHEKQILASCSKSGTTVTSIQTALLENFRLPLAPLLEQRRLARKLDRLFRDIERCEKHLENARNLLRQFRHEVLVCATTRGRFDKQNGTELWSFLPADEVCEKVQSGATPTEGFSVSGIPFLKVYNIVDQKVSFDFKRQYIREEIHEQALSRSKVLPGDVVMNIVGPPLGKVAIIPQTYAEWNINQALTLFRPSERVRSEWIYFVLCAGEHVREILPETKGSAGQINISLSQCRSFVFPVPPLEEQDLLIEKIKILFGHIEDLEKKLTVASSRAELLSSSILRAAFAGELSSQRKNDEAASKLISKFEAVTREQEKTRAELKKVNRGNSKMSKKALTKSAVEEVIRQMPARFTFDELRGNFAGDYESLKEVVFSLLTESSPLLAQIFDPETEQMMLAKELQ